MPSHCCPSIVCLGEILIERCSQQAGVPLDQTADWCPLPGGALANVACGLAKLGDSVSFVGAVGQDAWGDALLTLLSDMGVNHAGVQRRLKAPTREVSFPPIFNSYRVSLRIT